MSKFAYSIIFLIRTNVDELKKASLDEEVFDTLLCEEDETEDPDLTDNPPPTANVPTDVPYLQLVQMEKCIVFTDRILDLLQMVHGGTWYRRWEYIKTYIGSCLVLTWMCSSGHFGGSWSAQPLTNRMHAGNLLLSSYLLLSGNSYLKLHYFLNFSTLSLFPKAFFISTEAFLLHQLYRDIGIQ